uniref:Uncharacterized protein n=1 Tax=Graphocephala atropunctata TaxID=36148 RepID=A0A1B6LP74_9HEMI
MARRNKKAVKNDKKINSSIINAKKGGKVVKKKPEVNSKKKSINDKIKCPKCSKFFNNTNRSKSLVCAACLKKETIASEKTVKPVTKSKLISNSTLKQSTQVRLLSKRGMSSSNLDNKNDPKPNPKSPKVKSSRKSTNAIKIQTNSISKRKSTDVVEKLENKRQVNRSKTQNSLKPTTLNKKELSVATTKKTESKMGLRGRKRSYSQLASGIKLENENQVKKQKNSEVNRGVIIRNSRNKKPTIKGSEWLNTIHSKKSVSPKQDKNKKDSLKSPTKTKSPKSKILSPTKGKKNESLKVLSSNIKTNTSSKRSVPQNSKSNSLPSKGSVKQKELSKPTKLKNKTPKVTSTKQAISPTQTRKITKRTSKKQEKTSTKEKKILESNEKSTFSDSLVVETEICLTDKNMKTKENVLIVQDILHGILNSIHYSVDPDPVSEKEGALGTVVGVGDKETINGNRTIDLELEDNSNNQTFELILNTSSSNSVPDNCELSRSPKVERIQKNPNSDPVTDSAITEHMGKTADEKQEQKNNEKDSQNYSIDHESLDVSFITTSKSDDFTTETKILQNINSIKNKSSVNENILSDMEFSQDIKDNQSDLSKNISEVLKDNIKSINISETNCKDSSSGTSGRFDVHLEKNKNTNEPIKNQTNNVGNLMIENVKVENFQSNLSHKDIVSNENNSNNYTEEIEKGISNCVESVNQESSCTRVKKQDSVQEDPDNHLPQGTSIQQEKGDQERSVMNASVNKSPGKHNFNDNNGTSNSEAVQICLSGHETPKSDIFDNSCVNSSVGENCKESKSENCLNINLMNTSSKDFNLSTDEKLEKMSNPDASSRIQVGDCSELVKTTSTSQGKNSNDNKENNCETSVDQLKFIENNLNENESNEKYEPKLMGENVTSVVTLEEKGLNKKGNIVGDTANLSVDGQRSSEKNVLETSEESHNEENNISVNPSSNLAICDNKKNTSEVSLEKCFSKENGLCLERKFSSTVTTVIIDEHTSEKCQEENMSRDIIISKEKEASNEVEKEVIESSEDKKEHEKIYECNSKSQKQSMAEVSLKNTTLDTDQSNGITRVSIAESRLEIKFATQEMAIKPLLSTSNKNLSNDLENHVSTNKEDTSVVFLEDDTKSCVYNEHKNDQSVVENTLSLNVISKNEENLNNPKSCEDKSSSVSSQEVLQKTTTKNEFDQDDLAEVTKHPKRSDLDKLEENKFSETSLDCVTIPAKPNPSVELTAKEVVTHEEIEVQLPTSSISENMEYKMLQPKLAAKEIETSQDQRSEVKLDSSMQVNIEAGEIISKNEQSHGDKHIQDEKDVCQSSTKENIEFESELQLKPHLDDFEDMNVHGKMPDFPNIEEAATCKTILKSESTPAEINTVVEEKVGRNVTCDITVPNTSTLLTNEDPVINLDGETAENKIHFDLKEENVKQSTPEEPKLDINYQTENNITNEQANKITPSIEISIVAEEETYPGTDKISLDKTKSDMQKDEEMSVDDQTTVEGNNDGDYRTKFVSVEENQSIDLVSATNKNFSASENHIDVDIENSKPDFTCSKMEDIGNDSISVDDTEGESMQCNSETHSSNRMSVDEDNVVMDLDTDDTAVEVDLCVPTFETKLGNELNMEVS